MSEDPCSRSTASMALLGRKRSVEGEVISIHDGERGEGNGGVNTKNIKVEDPKKSKNQEDEVLLDLSAVTSTNDSYLTNLPSNLLTNLGSFLNVNDMTAMTCTCQKMYTAKNDYRCDQKHRSLFECILEEKLPLSPDLKTVLQPFRFLFQSPKYGSIQVDFALVYPPEGGYQRGTPILRRRFRHAPKAPWEEVMVRINIQKKFPCDDSSSGNTPKVIFRIDQSLPGCCFHFESKYVVGWDAGNLGYLVQYCVTRAAELFVPHGVAKTMPAVDDILTKFQSTIRENVLRGVKDYDHEKNENK